MTRIGVVSDSHNMTMDRLEAAANLLKTHGVRRLIHLGDGARDADKLQAMLGVPLSAVSGNCDDMPSRAQELTLTIGGTKILVCHGHRLHVKGSLIRLKLRCEELGAQVALFGHTHRALADVEGGILLLNPGALKDGCFAVLKLDGGMPKAALYGRGVEKFL